MALVNCRECGKEVSNQAKVCPHCGARRRNKVAGVIVAVLLLPFIYAFETGTMGMTPAEFLGLSAVILVALLAWGYRSKLGLK
jgi:hypothetical protein